MVWGSVMPWQSAAAQSPAIIADCNQFADVVNQNEAAMATFEIAIANFSQNAAQAATLADITAAAEQYVAAVANVTEHLDTVSVDLQELPIADTQLVSYRDEYAVVMQGFSAALKQAGNAMNGVARVETEAQLLQEIEVVSTQTATVVPRIEQLSNQEADLIDGVNAYCGNG